jgi:hypothetical protein
MPLFTETRLMLLSPQEWAALATLELQGKEKKGTFHYLAQCFTNLASGL